MIELGLYFSELFIESIKSKLKSAFPNGTSELQLPACSSHYPFNAERQAGKL